MEFQLTAARARAVRICAIVFAFLSIASFALAQVPWP
jgi:hypothetical protein